MKKNKNSLKKKISKTPLEIGDSIFLIYTYLKKNTFLKNKTKN